MQPAHQPSVTDAIDDLYEGLLPHIGRLVACIEPEATTLDQARDHVLKIARAHERTHAYSTGTSTHTTIIASSLPSALSFYGQPLYDAPAVPRTADVNTATIAQAASLF